LAIFGISTVHQVQSVRQNVSNTGVPRSCESCFVSPCKVDNVKSGAWLPIGNAIFYLLTCKLSTRQTLAGCRLAVSDFYTNA
jgi:hypothetical protein